MTVLIIPSPDLTQITKRNSATGRLSLINPAAAGAGIFLGAIILNTITQLEVDKGNVITAHRVDGGYALTQRGGNNDDRVFVRILLTGPQRFFIKEKLSFFADNKQIPLSFFSLEHRMAKCQIESFKLIVNSERQQAFVIHIIFRQLRTFGDNLISLATSLASAGVIGGFSFFSGNDIYAAHSSRQTSGGGIDLLTFATREVAQLITNAGN